MWIPRIFFTITNQENLILRPMQEKPPNIKIQLLVSPLPPLVDATVKKYNVSKKKDK